MARDFSTTDSHSVSFNLENYDEETHTAVIAEQLALQ